MLKTFTPFFFALLVSFGLQAQLPDGTIVDNFITTTLDSAEFNLYEELAEGRPVFIDVSATWCGPCWSYHNGGAYKSVYNTYGPAGTDEIRMIFIEGDPATNIACIYGPTGCVGNTQGNWTLNTPYPIADDAAAADMLQTSYFPTLYLVCPDRSITETGQLSAANLMAAANACAKASGAINAYALGMKSGANSDDFCGTVEVAPSFTLMNFGSTNLTSATVKLIFNGTVLETMDWTGDLTTYDATALEFGSYTFDEPGELSIEVSNPNGATDEDLVNNVAKIALTSKVSDEQLLKVKVRTDDYGKEFYWEARMADGTVIGKGGNEAVGPNGGGQYTGSAGSPNSPTAYGNNVTVTKDVVLPEAGCYYFHLVDGYGDGICCDYGDGYFKVYLGSDVAQANALIEVNTFEDYGRSNIGTSDAFVGIEEVLGAEGFRVFPSPANSNLQVSFDLKNSAEVGLMVTDVMGRVVKNIAPVTTAQGQHRLVVPVSDLSNGVYLATLRTEKGSITQKFVVQH